MANQIYRGYEYDTEKKVTEIRNQSEKHADLIYRGVHHESAKERSREDVTAPAVALWYRGYQSS